MREQLSFLVPDGGVSFSMTRHQGTGDLEQMVEGSKRWLAAHRDAFMLQDDRSGHWQDGPFEARSFLGRYEEEGRPYALYHVMLKSEAQLHIFTAHGPVEDFDRVLPMMEEVVRGLQWDEAP
jgi:hypothetical protein